MHSYIETFIRNKANEIPDNCIENVNKYLPFYNEVQSDDLSYLFAYLHYKLNDLLQFMNDKMNANNYHYNAYQSRDLISIVNDIRQIQKAISNTKFDFIIDNTYKEIIILCEKFLSSSGGSAIPEEMNKIDIIEFKPIFKLKNKNSPIESNIIFDDEYIHAQWQKALERKINDPEGAITAARTLIESILKHILDEKNIDYNEYLDLSELYKEVAKILNLAPEQHQEKIFKQILGGANGIISGLGSLRNKLGDAHGKSKKSIKPKERHSELAVNIAGTMALFIYKTYKEQIDA